MAAPTKHRAPGRDPGFTLVELLVTMGISSVLLVAIGVVFLSVFRGVTTIDVKTATTADARIMMEAMTRTLRVSFKPAGEAAAFTIATRNDVSFYALIYPKTTGAATPTAAPDPTLVRYSYDGTCVNQTLTSAVADSTGTLSWPAARAVTSCLARTTDAPVFTYYKSGTASATPMSGSGTPVTGGDLTLIRSVQITVTAQDPSARNISAVPLTDRVTMTNIA